MTEDYQLDNFFFFKFWNLAIYDIVFGFGWLGLCLLGQERNREKDHCKERI